MRNPRIYSLGMNEMNHFKNKAMKLQSKLRKMKTLKETKFVTDLERQVIQNIIDSEYMHVAGEQMINWAVWSFSVTNETKKLAGALGSLVKKGLCVCDVSEGDETCALTADGYAWAKNNNLI